jgi:hypothetical protein
MGYWGNSVTLSPYNLHNQYANFYLTERTAQAERIDRMNLAEYLDSVENDRAILRESGEHGDWCFDTDTLLVCGYPTMHRNDLCIGSEGKCRYMSVSFHVSSDEHTCHKWNR